MEWQLVKSGRNAAVQINTTSCLLQLLTNYNYLIT